MLNLINFTINQDGLYNNNMLALPKKTLLRISYVKRI